MPRIAVLHHGSTESPSLMRFRQSLQERATDNGVNCSIEALGADGRLERIPRLTAELLSCRPDVVVALGAVAALAVQAATRSLPILHATVLEPSDIGLIGCNLTGVTTFHPPRAIEHLRLLKQLLPELCTVACLFDPEAPRGPKSTSPLLTALREAANCNGIALRCIALRDMEDDVGSLIDDALRAGAGALVALEVPSVLARLHEIACAATERSLPTLLPQGYGVRGTFISGPGLPDAAAALADHVVCVLRGIPVAHVPVHRLDGSRLTIDRGMAKAAGAVAGCELPERN